MALFLLNPGITPLGDFDCLDTDQAAILGGEIMTLDETDRTVTADEKGAADVYDGYIADLVDSNVATATRVVARIANDDDERHEVFYLSDDGTTHYGTLFGSVIGNPVGLTTVAASALGPSTLTGSGKVTLWDKPGMYAVSTDAIDAALVPVTAAAAAGQGVAEGLFDTPLPGELLYRSTAGRLCRLTCTRISTGANKIGTFIELSGNGSLVTTPARLVGAAEVFDRIKIHYFGAWFSSAGA